MKAVKYLHRTILALFTALIGFVIAISVSTMLGIIIGLMMPLAFLSLLFLQDL